MKIMYVTTDVLGDNSAKAAYLFPKYAVEHTAIEKIVVADYQSNKKLIKEKIGADYLKLHHAGNTAIRIFRNAYRIAHYAKANNIDCIHFFYRMEVCILLSLVRILLLCFGCKSKIIIDHRSVDLSKGRRRYFKLMLNQLLQLSTHHLCGNPDAVETNHPYIYKDKSILDLGYDGIQQEAPHSDKDTINIWYIGSLKPRNRNTQFILELFEYINVNKDNLALDISINVAGPTNKEQRKRLLDNGAVSYLGVVAPHALYKLMQSEKSIGLAFMDKSVHQYAPALKFIEYAALNYPIVASNTHGLRKQQDRTGYPNVIFADQNIDSWFERIKTYVNNWPVATQKWPDRHKWSYKSIFENQCIPLYKKLSTANASADLNSEPRRL